ncbi:MAG: flagellar basal body rod protein FlgC [Planctomycetota bacterium]
MIRALDTSTSALTAQRIRMDVIAGNIANAEVTRQADGSRQPFRRRYVTFQTGDGRGGPGVHVHEVRTDPGPFRRKYDPGHADAGPDGYVQLPNVSITMEYVDALAASRAYDVNAGMLNVTRSMVQQALRLLA